MSEEAADCGCDHIQFTVSSATAETCGVLTIAL